MNLFKIMRSNRAENDERIASERLKTSLRSLRFVQFTILFLQLAGIVLSIVSPGIDFLMIPEYIYMLIIVPFIVDPLIAAARGYLGAIRSDSAFFVVGMIEFGYMVYAAMTYIVGLMPWVLISAFIVGMLAYYFIAYALYKISDHRAKSVE